MKCTGTCLHVIHSCFLCVLLSDPHLPPWRWDPNLCKSSRSLSVRRRMGLRWNHECASRQQRALIPVYTTASSHFCSFSSACTPLKKDHNRITLPPSFRRQLKVPGNCSEIWILETKILFSVQDRPRGFWRNGCVEIIIFLPSFTLLLFLIPFLQVPEAPTDGETKERVRIRTRIRASERRDRNCWFVRKIGVGPCEDYFSLWALYPSLVVYNNCCLHLKSVSHS